MPKQLVLQRKVEKAPLINHHGGVHGYVSPNRKGEGSRGGKVVGHTQSGKAVYEDRLPHHYMGWTAGDHDDAADLHSRTSLLGNEHHHYAQELHRTGKHPDTDKWAKTYPKALHHLL